MRIDVGAHPHGSKAKAGCVTKAVLANALDVLERVHFHRLDATDLPISSQPLGASPYMTTTGHHALAPSSGALNYFVM